MARYGGDLNRTGLFGGTFNPIHLGHVGSAREVQQRFALDHVVFIPSALPPHKTPVDIVDATDRFEMTRLAISDDTDFSISDIELERTGPSYTIDTVLHFNQALPRDTQLFFIVGLDAFLEMDTWRSYRMLFDSIPLIVITRPGIGPAKALENAANVEAYLREHVSSGYRFDAVKRCCVDPEKQPVYLHGVTPRAISSTRIRDPVRRGMPIGSLVTEAVESYINAQGLYR